MATKKKAGSKKGSAQKLEAALVANDPPIVVSGGGGGFNPNVPARNNITVGFRPKGALGHRDFSAHTNRATEITGVQVTFPGTGVRPVSISNLALYTIEITFITTDEPPRAKSGAAASRKGKAAGRRPAASKRPAARKRK